VMLELLVEHQAGLPVLMPPLSGHTSDAKPFGHVVKESVTQLLKFGYKISHELSAYISRECPGASRCWAAHP
jgi:hypothetical protein